MLVTVQSEVFESLACESRTPALGGLSVRRPTVHCADNSMLIVTLAIGRCVGLFAT